MSTKRNDSVSIWKVAGICLLAMTLSLAGSASASELRNEDEVTLSGSQGEEQHFFIVAPAGADSFSFFYFPGTGDVGLYFQHGTPPTRSTHHPLSPGRVEGGSTGGGAVVGGLPGSGGGSGTWYFMVYGFEDFSDFDLEASYDCSAGNCEVTGEEGPELTSGIPVTGLSGDESEELRFFLEVPDGVRDLKFSLSGGTGDADLYVKRGSSPTLPSDHHCESAAVGNEELCTFDSPRRGTWHVMVLAFAPISGVTLEASFDSSGCTPSSNGLCLNDNRFRVEVEWRDFQGNTGFGEVVPNSSADSGLFWFFNPDNWEMMVKVIKGCRQNGHYWVFAAATTNVEYTLRVTDTETGAEVNEYHNPLGNAAAAIIDTTAFASCP